MPSQGLAPFAHHLHQPIEGLGHAPHLLIDLDVAVAVLAAKRMDVEHGGHHPHRPVHPPGADQGLQRTDEEIEGVALAEFLDLFHNLLKRQALPAQFGQLEHHQGHAGGSAFGIHHMDLHIGIFRPGHVGGHAGGGIGSAEPRGNGDHEDLLGALHLLEIGGRGGTGRAPLTLDLPGFFHEIPGRGGVQIQIGQTAGAVDGHGDHSIFKSGLPSEKGLGHIGRTVGEDFVFHGKRLLQKRIDKIPLVCYEYTRI